MKCPNDPVLISAYSDGELSPEQSSSLENHIVQCDTCRQKIRKYQELGQALVEQTLPPIALQPLKLSSSPTFKRHLAYGALSGLTCWIWSQSSLSELALPVGWILWALLLASWGWRRGRTSLGPLTTPTLLACTTTISAFWQFPLAWKLAPALYLVTCLSCVIKNPLRLFLAGTSLGLAAGLEQFLCLALYALTFLGLFKAVPANQKTFKFVGGPLLISWLAPGLVVFWVLVQAIQQAPNWTNATRIQVEYLFFWVQQHHAWLPWLALGWGILIILPLHSRRMLISSSPQPLKAGQIWALLCYLQTALAYALASSLCSGQDLHTLPLQVAQTLLSSSLLPGLVVLSLVGLQMGLRKQPIPAPYNQADLQLQAKLIYLVPLLLLVWGMTWSAPSLQPVHRSYQRLRRVPTSQLTRPDWLQQSLTALGPVEYPALLTPGQRAQAQRAAQAFLTDLETLSPQERKTWASDLAEGLSHCAQLNLLNGNLDQALVYCLEAQHLYPSFNWELKTTAVYQLLKNQQLSLQQLKQIEAAWAPPAQAPRNPQQIWCDWIQDLNRWPADLEDYRQYQLDQSLAFRRALQQQSQGMITLSQFDSANLGQSGQWDSLGTAGNQALLRNQRKLLLRSQERFVVLLAVSLARHQKLQGRLPKSWANFQSDLPADLQAQLDTFKYQNLGKTCQITLKRPTSLDQDTLLLEFPLR